MPLALLQIHRIAGGARGWKPAVLLGLTVAAQFASCVYYTVYFVTVLPVLTLLLLVRSQQAVRRSLAQLAIAALLRAPSSRSSCRRISRNRDVVGERAPRELVARIGGAPRLPPRAPAESGSTGGGIPSARRNAGLFPGFTTLGLAAAGLAAPVALAGPTWWLLRSPSIPRSA